MQLERQTQIMESSIKSAVDGWDWRTLPALTQWVTDEAIRIQQIAAPTFYEGERALHVANRFGELGLQDIELDRQNNVLGRLHGDHSRAAILVLAHTDTVFSAETDLHIRRNGNRIFGPGLGDNSLGVAALLGLIKTIRDENVSPGCDIWFVASSCEEGLGDLRGARAAYASLRSRISAVINLEGLAFGHVYNAGIAVRRLHIKAKTEGGHSWLHHGRPSAVHGILELGARIANLSMPDHPRTTCNVGMIDGGHAINAIAMEASLWLDMRSVCPTVLDDLNHQVLQLVDQMKRDGLGLQIEKVGERPAGSLAEDHVLVRGALAALAEIGVRGTLETGSTDGNVTLAHGCPTVTIGITRGGNAHRLDEFIEVSPIRYGMKQLITLAIAAAEHYASDTDSSCFGSGACNQ